MYNFDMGAWVLYSLYGAILCFFIYLLFDIKSFYSTSTSQRYVAGSPQYSSYEDSAGHLEIIDGKISFLDEHGEKEYFSVPLEDVGTVRTGARKEADSASLVNRVSKYMDEENYLYIKLHKGEMEQTLEFSAHKASPVNEVVMNRILKAKSSGL